jgi:hypothetical protein
MENTYTFKLPIGDWSSDGHGYCENYLLSSNAPVQEVREAYFEAINKVGSSLDSATSGHEAICCEYEDSSINSEQLDELGLDINKYKEKYEDSLKELIDDEEGLYYEIEYLEPEDFVYIFIDFMQTHAPHISLKVLPENHVEMFPYCGYDSKNRHIGQFGYGLFSL